MALPMLAALALAAAAARRANVSVLVEVVVHQTIERELCGTDAERLSETLSDTGHYPTDLLLPRYLKAQLADIVVEACLIDLSSWA